MHVPSKISVAIRECHLRRASKLFSLGKFQFSPYGAQVFESIAQKGACYGEFQYSLYPARVLFFQSCLCDGWQHIFASARHHTCVEHVRGIDIGFIGLIRVCIVHVTVVGFVEFVDRYRVI